MAMGRRRAKRDPGREMVISSASGWRDGTSRASAGHSDDTPNGGNDGNGGGGGGGGGEGSGAEGGGGSGGEGEGELGWDGRVGGGEGSGGMRRAHAGGGRASCCDGHVGRPREKVAFPRSIAPSEDDRGKTSHSMPPAAAVAQAAASSNRQQVEETHAPSRAARVGVSAT